MQDVAVIEDAAAAEVSLDPIRARILAELAEPHTATTLATRLGLARQKVNYHVKMLEQHGLVELVEAHVLLGDGRVHAHGCVDQAKGDGAGPDCAWSVRGWHGP